MSTDRTQGAELSPDLSWETAAQQQRKESPIRRVQNSLVTLLRVTTLSLLVIFALQNLSSTPMTFLFWTADFPLFLVVLVFTMLGFSTGYVAKRSAMKNKAKAKAKKK